MMSRSQNQKHSVT